MAILLHGTTQHRAEQILIDGPDPLCCGPEGFWTCLEQGPFWLGLPEDYARQKADLFKGEGGPAILAMDVPDEIIALTIDEWYPLSQGVVQFEMGKGLQELRAAWRNLSKEIRMVTR